MKTNHTKKLTTLMIVLLPYMLLALDRDFKEWSYLVSRCAIDTSSISNSMSRIDAMSQPTFAIDVIDAMIAFPGPKIDSKTLEFASRELMLASSECSMYAVRDAIVNVVPSEFRTNVEMIVDAICKSRPYGCQALQYVTGPNDEMMLIINNMTTSNCLTHIGMFMTPVEIDSAWPRIDLGILRNPHPEIVPEDSSSIEPGPYQNQRP